MAINPTLDQASSTATPSIDKVILDAVVPPTSKLDADQYMVNDIDGATESLSGSGNLNYQLMQAQLLADGQQSGATYGASRYGGDAYEPASGFQNYAAPAPMAELEPAAGNPSVLREGDHYESAPQVASYSDAAATVPTGLDPTAGGPFPAPVQFDDLNTGTTAVTDTPGTTTNNSNNTTTTTINNTTINETNINNYTENHTINYGDTTINYGDIDIDIGGGGGDGGDGGDGGGLGDIIETIINNTTTIIENVTNTVVDITENLGDTVENIVGDVTDIVGDVTDVVGDVTDVVGDVLGDTTDVLNNVVDVVGDTIHVVDTSILQPVVDAVVPLLDDVTGTVGDVLGNVTDVLGDLTGGLGDGNPLGGGLADIVQPLVEGITDTTSGILPPVIDAAENVLTEALQPVATIVDDLTGSLGQVPVVSDIVNNLINTDNLLGQGLIDIGASGSADHDVATGGDLNDITTALLGGSGDIGINGVEDLAGDVDLGLNVSQVLLGDGGSAAEASNDLSLDLNLDILGHDVVTDGIGLNLDVVEQLIGDTDIQIDLSANVLGDVADTLLDAAPGGADTLLQPLGDVLSDIGGQVLTALDQGNDQSLLLDDQILSHLTDNLAEDPAAAVGTLFEDVSHTVDNVVNTVTHVDVNELLGGTTDIVNSLLGSLNGLDGDIGGAIADIANGGGAAAPLSSLIETASSIADTPWVEPLTSNIVSDIADTAVDQLGSVLSDPVAGVGGILGDVLGGGHSGGGSDGGGHHGGLGGGLRGLFG